MGDGIQAAGSATSNSHHFECTSLAECRLETVIENQGQGHYKGQGRLGGQGKKALRSL